MKNIQVPKQYRKYLKFSKNDLDKLIDFDSYTFYKFGENIIKEFNSYTELHKRFFYKCMKFSEAIIYKHKTKEEYLFRIKCNNDVELYFYSLDEDIKCIHRDNLPAIIEHKWYMHVNVITLTYIVKNVEHRLYGPQYIEYTFEKNSNEKPCNVYLQYFQNDKRHRVNGPAFVSICKNKFFYIEYYINDELIKDKPSKIQYNDIGAVDEIIIMHDDYHEKYQFIYTFDSINNKYCKSKIIHSYLNVYEELHNLTGPAIITKNYTTKETVKTWHIDGIEFPDDVIKIENNEIQYPITKQDIIKTLLFDREYGNLVKDLIKNKSKV